MQPASSVLAFEHVSHSFPSAAGPVHVLDDVSFSVRPGSFTAIIGPSGCGKSTLLAVASGLLRPSEGEGRQDGRPIRGVNRSVGLVPQGPMLLPWKTLVENVELPLRLRGVNAADRRARASEAVASVGLAGFEHHYPNTLSGGMQKRGSIARTLVYRPACILMDEPFGALDAQTRMVMQADMQELAARHGTTVILVTHDIGEAVLLADDVVVMSRRPARVLARIPVELARPRNIFEPLRNPGFDEAYGRVWAAFRSEVLAGRADDAA